MNPVTVKVHTIIVDSLTVLGGSKTGTDWGMVLFCLALLFSGAAIFALAKQVRGLELKVNELQLRLRAHMKGIEIE